MSDLAGLEKMCIDCGLVEGEIESLDDGMEVPVIVRARPQHNDDLLCERCTLDRDEAEEQLRAEVIQEDMDIAKSNQQDRKK